MAVAVTTANLRVQSFACALCACASLFLPLAQAQVETGSAQAAQSAGQVEVRELRNPALMAYKDAYDMLSKFQQSGKYPLVDLKISVRSSNKAVPSGAINLNLVGDTINVPIPVAADGRVHVPLLPEALRDNAEIVSNRPKRSLTVDIEFLLRVPRAQRYDYREVMAALPQAVSALREFTPWYLRWLTPSFGAAEFRFPEGVRATATVKRGTRIESFQADESGRIRIRLQTDWLAGDTRIDLSDTPLEIVPTVSAEAKRSSYDSTGG